MLMPTARIVLRTSTDVSAASTGDSAATESSSCPAPASGWNCSTAIPCRTRASIKSRRTRTPH